MFLWDLQKINYHCAFILIQFRQVIDNFQMNCQNQINIFVGQNKLPKANPSMLTLKKIENFSYIVSDEIGLGLTSKVYKGKNQNTNQIVAVKVIDLKRNQETQFLNDQVNALEKIQKADTEHLLKLEGVFKTKNNLYIITEFCQGKDCGKILRKKRTFSQIEAQTIMKQLIKGYNELYKLQIVHRDLKLFNIFVKKGKIKIADFGFALNAQACEKRSEFNVGSPTYMAPQALKNNMYSYKSDIWAMGVMAFQMVYGRAPWKDRNDQILYEMIHNSPLQEQFGFAPISESYKNFIRRCLTVDLNQRATPEFIANYQWPMATDAIDGMDKLEPLKPSSLMKIPQKPATTVRQIKSNNNIDLARQNERREPSPNRQMPFYQSSYKPNSTTGNVGINGLYQNNSNNNHSNSVIGLINAGNEVSTTSSPFKEIASPYFGDSSPKTRQTNLIGSKVGIQKPQSSIVQFHSSSQNYYQPHPFFNQHKLNVSTVQEQTIYDMQGNIPAFGNGPDNVQSVLLAQLHYCRFIAILYDKIIQNQNNLASFQQLREQIGQSLLEKIKKMSDICQSGQNLLNITGFFEYTRKDSFSKLRQTIYQYQMKYQKKLSKTGLHRNQFHTHFTGVIGKVIKDIKPNLSNNLRLLQLLTNYYQIQDLENRLSPEKFAQCSKIQFLASKKVYNNLSAQRLLNRMQCLGL